MNRISNILQFDSPYWTRDAAAVSVGIGAGWPFGAAGRCTAPPGRPQQRRRRVASGRASAVSTFANTLKYISMSTSANFGNMVSMALATPLLPFLPLAAKQILLNNFLSDVPSITISSDNVDPDRVAQP